MSGVFSYDGYIYQTIVILHLLLEWILSDNGLSSIFIEVEDEEGEFSVDAVFVSSDGKKVTYCEIKGGEFSAPKCIEKLKRCSEYFKRNSLIGSTSEEEFRIVYRNEKQMSAKDYKDYVQYLMNKPNDLFPGNFRKHRFGITENASLESISDLIRKIVPQFDSDRERIRIYLNLSHFIETEVRALAENLRNGSSGPKYVKIELDDILDASDSFTETIAAKYPELFKNKEVVLQELHNILSGGGLSTLFVPTT